MSVVMPFLNEGQEPVHTVRSLLATSGGVPLDIVAIDDGSQVPPVGLAELPGVRLVRNPRRLGSAGSKHKGVLMARAEHVLVIDAHMRFRSDGWLGAFDDALRASPTTALCSVCLGLDADNMDVDRPRGAYHAADLAFVDHAPSPDRPARQILEPRWAPRQGEGRYAVPCILGAAYGFSKRWFRYIRGLEGLMLWGTEEPFLSLKSWLAGGGCELLGDVGVGHRFREHAPYRTPVHHLVYNKLWVCRTILPHDLAERLISAMPRDAAFRRAEALLHRNRAALGEARAYYDDIFVRSVHDYCARFGLRLP